MSFGSSTDRKGHTKYYLPAVEVKDYNVIIDAQNIFNQLVESNLRTYDDIQKIATDQGDD